MNCKQCKDLMIMVAFGEAERSEEFGRHLDVCPGCRREFAAAAFAAQGIEDAPPAPSPSLSNERLHQAILSANLKSRSAWRPRFALAGGFAAAIAAAWFGMSLPRGESGLSDPIATVMPDARDIPITEEFSLVPPAPMEDPIRAAAPPQTAEVVASRPSARVSQPRRRPSVRAEEIVEEWSPVPAELFAAAEPSAARSFTDRTAATELAGPQPDAGKPAIIVIQPEGHATEIAPDDVPIGG